MKKSLALTLAILMVIGIAVGGTIAWLTDDTEAVVNKFTASDVDIDLGETTGNEYQMIPGATIEKDPKVTVLADSEACFVYVQLTKSANFDDFMTYEMAEGWEQLKNGETPVPGVYYRAVDKNATAQEFPVLKDNEVKVKDSVDKEMMDGLSDANYPTLTVKAYAIQQANGDGTFGAYEAWTEIDKT